MNKKYSSFGGGKTHSLTLLYHLAEHRARANNWLGVSQLLGKAIMMATEAETSEIIRRRLFEWDPRAVSQSGKVLLPKEALAVSSPGHLRF